MPRRLSYTVEALDDLHAVAGWLMQLGAGGVGRRRLRAIRAAIEGLRVYPCRHPAVHQAGVRELPCSGGYRAMYEVVPDTGRSATAGDVMVLRVYGPGQSRDGRAEGS